MNSKLEQIRAEAETDGLNLRQIELGYDRNPIPFALMRTDGVQDAVFLYVNPAFEVLSGLSADRLMGRSYRAVFAASSEQEREKLRRVATGACRAETHSFLDTFGRHMRLEFFSFDICGYVGCAAQVVSQQQLSKHLCLEDLANIGELVNGGLLVTTAGEPHQIVYCSEELYRLVGHESLAEFQEGVRERSLFSYIHASDVQPLRDQISELVRREKMHCILRVRALSGEYTWLSVQSKRAIFHGKKVAVTITHNINAEMVRITRAHKLLVNTTAQYYAAYYVDARSGIYYNIQQNLCEYAAEITPTGDYASWIISYAQNYIHPDDAAFMMDVLSLSAFVKNAERVDGQLSYVRQYRRKFGDRYEWVEVTMSMREPKTAEEEPIVICTFRNIHQDKLIEDEKRYMEVFSYAVTHSYESVLEMDLHNRILYEIQYGESGLFRLPRYDMTIESVHRYAVVHIHPDDMARFVRDFHPDTVSVPELFKQVQFEYRRRPNCDSEYRWCSYTLRRFEQAGHSMLVLFVSDIHEAKTRHQREQSCLQHAVLEAENRVSDKNRQLISYYGKTIELMSSMVEYRSMESGEHVRRIKDYTKELLKAAVELFPEQNLDDSKIHSITEASALHDVGKIGVPDNILLKPARLTKEEFEVMKQHTVIGADIAKEIPCVTECADESGYGYEIARYHHERYDGRGYPEGLRGDEIPFSAQIVAIADVYDALTTVRVYKDAYSTDEAFRMIMDGECGAFSPRMLRCFEKVKDRFVSIRQRYSDEAKT